MLIGETASVLKNIRASCYRSTEVQLTWRKKMLSVMETASGFMFCLMHGVRVCLLAVNKVALSLSLIHQKWLKADVCLFLPNHCQCSLLLMSDFSAHFHTSADGLWAQITTTFLKELKCFCHREKRRNVQCTRWVSVYHASAMSRRAAESNSCWFRLVFDGDEKNYELWETKFVGHLCLQGLRDIILKQPTNMEGEEDTPKNAAVYAELIQFLDDKSLV